MVGANAFAHESGIHQDGLIKEKTTYEIIAPESVGREETQLVLGKHSGRHAMKEHLKKMGYALTQQQLDRVTARFKEWACQNKDILPQDLKNMVREEIDGGKQKGKSINKPAHSSMRKSVPGVCRPELQLKHERYDESVGSQTSPVNKVPDSETSCR